MFFIEMFIMGVKNLHLHKLRSLLTALGIIFGVAAVIIMVAIGEGGKQEALAQLRQLGAKNILVRSVKPPESSDAGARQQRTLIYGIKRLDLARLGTLMKSEQHPENPVATMIALKDTEQRVVHGDTLATANAVGAEPGIFDVINLRLARGRYFNQVDSDRSGHVCVIGAYTAQTLFPYEDPIGQTIQVGSGRSAICILEVIGVLEPVGLRNGSEAASMMTIDPDKSVYFPMDVAQNTFGDAITKWQAGTFERKQIELSEIWLQARTIEEVEKVAAMARYIIQIEHPTLDYEIKAPIQILRTAERTAMTFNFILGGIAAISLLIGGIGIMNIMLANVTERTREIGIRRALGAKQKHITLQFLIETTVISLSGGIIGILVGCGGALALPAIVRYFVAMLRFFGVDVTTVPYPTSIATWSVAGSFIVSGVIGIGFGMYPAILAARMNPIEALRHE